MISLVAPLLALAIWPAVSSAQSAVTTSSEVVELEKLEVTSEQNNTNSIDAATAREALDQIAGGTGLISADDFEKGRVGSVADILALQPGVYAQTAQGSDGIKISIRGSGINRGTGFFRSGTQFYFDGLPLSGPGGTPYELFEPLGLKYTEILRGANAFDYGSVALGGAINYVTNTGYDAPSFALRFEAGSFGYYKGQVSGGRVLGDLDFYTSITGSTRDGFQEHSKAKSHGFAGNVGYRINPNLDTRFYLRYRRTDNETPGPLRQADIDADATQANPQNVLQNARRLQQGSTWMGNKTTFRFDDASSLVASLVYHDYPIWINPDPAPGNVNLPPNGANGPGTVDPLARLTNSLWWFSDLDVGLAYSRSDTLFERPTHSSLSVTTTIHPHAGVKVFENNPNITTGPNAFKTLVKQANYDGSSDTVLRLGSDTNIAENLWLTTGLAWVSIRRASEFEYVNPAVTLPAGYRQKFSRTDDHFVPRIGLRYNPAPDWQVFANVTRSVEPPNSWSPTTGSGVVAANNANNGFLIADLKDQTAVSYEIGTRASWGNFSGSLSLYHTDVKNELINVQIAAGPPPVTRELNGTPTKKEGIEVALDSVLWNGDDRADPLRSRHRLVLRQALTLNAFNYRNDPIYRKNELPGIPRQFYQGELLFEHRSGFYAGPGVQYASSNFVDYANTFEVHPYTIYGFKIGYDDPQGRWQAYLDLRNLTDKAHTVSVSPVFDTRANPFAANPTPADLQPNDLRLLSPGDGFGVFGGMALRF